MKSTNHLKTLIITSLYFCLLTSIVARDSVTTSTLTQTSIFSSLYNEDYIDITLESDFGKLIENKKTINYQDAWISYETNEGKEIRQLIQIRPRGKSRRTICDIPPVMLNFAKGNPDAIMINGDQKLKLVTHCLEENTEKGQQNILKEYLAYKLLNILTEKSFRVQLVRITYLNTINHDSSQRFGFIIEGNKELAKRLEATRTKERDIPVEQLETDQYNTVALYQYMISNTDWDVAKLQNVKAFVSESSGKRIIVPYDFDYSGLVYTGYAKLTPEYGQESIKERVFLGAFNDEVALNRTLKLFNSKKKELLSFCEDFDYLTKQNRRAVTTHVESFYKTLKWKKYVKREFIKCPSKELF